MPIEGCAADPFETNRALVGRTHVRRGEYLLIAIFETHAEAEAFAGTFETQLRSTSRDVRAGSDN